jgi:hypothetical protein
VAPSSARIEIEASFGVADKITLLHDIKIDLEAPNLWMIVGRVGSVSVAGC